MCGMIINIHVFFVIHEFISHTFYVHVNYFLRHFNFSIWFIGTLMFKLMSIMEKLWLKERVSFLNFHHSLKIKMFDFRRSFHHTKELKKTAKK